MIHWFYCWACILMLAVVTRWYKPPELCFRADQYSAAVDVWGVGCIFAELMLRRPLFAGQDDFDQLAKIFQVTVRYNTIHPSTAHRM